MRRKSTAPAGAPGPHVLEFPLSVKPGHFLRRREPGIFLKGKRKNMEIVFIIIVYLQIRDFTDFPDDRQPQSQ